MINLFQKKSPAYRAPFLSPRDLLQRAAAITAVYLLLHLAGLREMTSVLNGTVGSVALGWRLSGIFAAIYVIFYLSFVVLVPILILAALILAVWRKYISRVKTTSVETNSKEN